MKKDTYLEEVLKLPPFSLAKQEKVGLFSEILHTLTKHHYQNCLSYRKILKLMEFNPAVAHAVEDIPFVPVRLFKDFDLVSVKKNQIIKTLTSSGTTNQGVSKVFLDRITAANQTRVLIKIVSSFLGKNRLPMLVIDTRSVLKDRHLFSARGAGILGFSMFGYDITYAFDEDMRLDYSGVETFCKKFWDKEIFIFGFTYMIWEYFYKELAKSKLKLALEKAILFHGGGWKKLSDQKVDNNTFKRGLEKVCGIKRFFNYYGMVEQTGSIFIECESGFLHSSIFSDVIMRRTDFSVSKKREPGMVELLSLLPFSYPGHVILSEDIGEILGEDDCSCGRLGKYFKIHGRIKNAEIRGCSDTYSS